MNPDDAIALLQADHQRLGELIGAYEALAAGGAPAARRKALAEQICMQVDIQTRLEDELFYPLVHELLHSPPLLRQCAGEHARARALMCGVLLLPAGDPALDARVRQLAAHLRAHMALEHGQVFARVRACGLDLALLGRRLRERRAELEAVPEALREEALVSVLA